jgi:hypothetical protein
MRAVHCSTLALPVRFAKTPGVLAGMPAAADPSLHALQNLMMGHSLRVHLLGPVGHVEHLTPPLLVQVWFKCAVVVFRASTQM